MGNVGFSRTSRAHRNSQRCRFLAPGNHPDSGIPMGGCRDRRGAHRGVMEPSPPSTPHTRPRWPAAVPCAVAAGLLLAALGYGRHLASTAGPAPIDVVLWRQLDVVPVTTVAWGAISRLGNELHTVLAAIAIGLVVGVSWARRGARGRAVVLAAACPVLTCAVGVVLEFAMKPAVGRFWGPVPAYPSGHAGGTAAAVAIGAMLAAGWRTRWVVLSVGVLWSGAVGIAMAAKHSHFPTDILGGWTAGAASGVLAASGALLVAHTLARRAARSSGDDVALAA